MYSLRNFKLKGRSDALINQQHKAGKFITSYATFKVKLIGLPFVISKIEIDKEEMDLSELDLSDNSFSVSKEFTELHIVG